MSCPIIDPSLRYILPVSLNYPQVIIIITEFLFVFTCELNIDSIITGIFTAVIYIP